MTDVAGIAADRLRAFIERIERLEEERKALAADVRAVKAEAKAAGFDIGVITRIIAMRAKDPLDLAEEQELLDLYWRAVGVG